MAPRLVVLKAVLLFITLSFSCSAFAQQSVISGTVADDAGKPLPMASITLLNEQETVLSFTSSNDQGRFSLPLPAAGTLSLQVTYLGYKKQRVTVIPGQKNYTFRLVAEPAMLKDVIINNRPVLQRLGDTLHYQVNQFARPEDRSIADVLRRMPGIDVDEDGKIYYNGKPLANMYIHGDDLMSGRYNMAAKAIRKEDIIAVDLMRNHQPIKVNTGKVRTEDVALNLILKNENSIKLSGQGMLGAGLPRQYDATLTGIMLNKTFKTLSTAQANNSGISYAGQLRKTGSSNFIEAITAPQPAFSLSQGTVGNPAVPLVNYYRNNGGMFSTNTLYNGSNGWQYKINIAAFADRYKTDYQSFTQTFLAVDTINYHERQALLSRPRMFNGGLNIMANKNSYYINNSLQYTADNSYGSSALAFNTTGFNQYLRLSAAGISNDFTYMPRMGGRGVGELRWYTALNSNTQLLNIGPGYRSTLPAAAGMYSHVLQHLQLPAFYTQLSAAYKLTGTRLKQEYKAGFNYEKQKLLSNIQLDTAGTLQPYTRAGTNNLYWQHSTAYISPGYDFTAGPLQAKITLPAGIHSIRYNDEGYALHNSQSYFLFNPSAAITYNFSTEQRIMALYNYNRQLGNISGVYRGAILKNYRTLLANDAGLQNSDLTTAALTYQLEKSISLLFITAGLTYTHTASATMSSSILTDSVQRIVILPLANSFNTAGANVSISKYFYWLKGTAVLKAAANRATFTQIINGAQLPTVNYTYSLAGSVKKRLYNVISLEYVPAFRWAHTTAGSTADNAAQQVLLRNYSVNQSFVLGAHKYGIDAEVSARHSYVHQYLRPAQGYFFADAGLRRKFTRPRIDVSLSSVNLFNVKQYTEFYSSATQLSTNTYQLRGSMFILRGEWFF